MVTIEKLKEILDLVQTYPNVKAITVCEHVSIEFAEQKPQIVQTEVISTTDMPGDDVMLYASTPTFDEIIADRKE